MDWVDYAFILTAYVVASGIKGLTGYWLFDLLSADYGIAA